MNGMMSGESHVCTAKINGEEVEYDTCAQSRETHIEQEKKFGWVYLGKGVIWAINGIKQNFEEEHHFWKK